MSKVKLMLGDNIESLRKLPDNSIDSIVSDPPYGISFMNRQWDYDVPSIEFWKEVYRVLKPGGHVLSFGGTRTYHRMAVNIEDAGFEIRDQIMWLYGSGFPKSLNIGKAVDKLEGNEREVVGESKRGMSATAMKPDKGWNANSMGPEITITKGTSPYEGWGTALKPANEPICVARKPLSEKSVAENVLKWRTGGLNIEACRVGTEPISHGTSKADIRGGSLDGSISGSRPRLQVEEVITEGRFPANLILECICDELEKGDIIKGNENYKWDNTDCDGSNTFKSRGKYTPRTEQLNIHTNPDCPCRLMDEQSGVSKSTGAVRKKDTDTDATSIDYKHRTGELSNPYAGQVGGASRYFYQAKVSKKERNMGLEHFEETTSEQKGHGIDRVCMNEGCGVSMLKPELCKCEEPDWRVKPKKNSHPTVKPVSLMAYLCRLITPPGGIVLDPFMGSGSTGIAARLEGFKFCGMEMDKDYFKIAEARIENYEKYREFLK